MPRDGTGIDVTRLRADTPGCARVLHLNNAGAALPPTPVLDAVIGHLRREAEIGGYEAADEAAERVQAVYASIARLIGAAPDEIALVESATQAWTLGFHAFDLREGDRILTARAEYASNVIAFLHLARARGVVVEVVPSDADGALDVEALARMIDARTKLIAVTHVPTNGGLVNPAAAIGAVARAHGVPFLLDACQSVGQLPIDVGAIGCDMLSATGRKFLRGPRGTGFLYVRRALLDRLRPPFLDLHSARWTGPRDYAIEAGATRFEFWESAVANRLGLGAAADYALAVGIVAMAARIGGLAETLRHRLAALPGVAVHDLGRERCGIVTFTVPGMTAREASARLRAQGINTSVSTAPFARWDMEPRGLAELVRASPHAYNTEDELDRFIDAVAGLGGGTRDG
ncbi:aminotransferase class V-fold PLP-dependent enzyme [Elioraea tepidiphila]|uniref:aminotransferase class V-fold PLP-dependent enzyme n=1 Tax=Elioraea tepidiphila TaxID=457934 RepID=UPI00036604D0|nr:aminotransferase class V-fold PLP-dependent enzyme [Elioraea tepidiphila]